MSFEYSCVPDPTNTNDHMENSLVVVLLLSITLLYMENTKEIFKLSNYNSSHI